MTALDRAAEEMINAEAELSLAGASWPVLLVLGWLCLLVILSVYRLLLSPIAHIPGPKLAAVTRLYEAYYNIVLGGQYTLHIDALHDIYGPIIRVAPDEIHVRDSSFYDELYARNPRIEKPGWEVKFGTPSSAFTTVNATLHRRRRAALNPMFSRRSVLLFEEVIRRHTEVLCQRLAEFRATKQPLSVDKVMPAFTGDIVMEYSVGYSYKHLESPSFESFHEAFTTVGNMSHIIPFIPWANSILNLIPDLWVEKIQPAMASLLRLRRDQWSISGRAISSHAELDSPTDNSSDQGAKATSKQRTTVFSEIFSSSTLSTSDKSHKRLFDEAHVLVGAGVETTAFALTVGIFHIVNTAHIRQRLQDELFAAFPMGYKTIPSLHELEKLPYLKACIQESLRLSYGISARNPRRHPDRALRYEHDGKEYIIPKGTTVSMNIVDVHHDDNLFPDSHRFVPERWLQNPKAPDGRPLEQYLVAFGKGTRVCLGMNLAWAELYFVLGMVFRRFDLELHETDESDVRYCRDYLTPRVKLDSKGVRVIVY